MILDDFGFFPCVWKRYCYDNLSCWSRKIQGFLGCWIVSLHPIPSYGEAFLIPTFSKAPGLVNSTHISIQALEPSDFRVIELLFDASCFITVLKSINSSVWIYIYYIILYRYNMHVFNVCLRCLYIWYTPNMAVAFLMQPWLIISLSWHQAAWRSHHGSHGSRGAWSTEVHGITVITMHNLAILGSFW